MFTYNKKVRLKPYEGIPLADFNVEPDAPPLRMIVRPGKMFPSHSRTDLTRTKQVVAPMNLRRPKSAMDLSRDSSQGFQSRNSYYASDSPTDEIAESSRELIECLPKMTAVKHDKKDSDKVSVCIYQHRLHYTNVFNITERFSFFGYSCHWESRLCDSLPAEYSSNGQIQVSIIGVVQKNFFFSNFTNQFLKISCRVKLNFYFQFVILELVNQ